MALKERNRMLRITDAGGGSLVAPSHESYLVRGLYMTPAADDDYLTLVIDGVTVGKWRVNGLAGNHLPYPAVKTTQDYEATTGGLLAWLAAKGVEVTYPVASGQTFTLTAEGTTCDLTVVYDAYDRDDITKDGVNGSEARLRRYLHYITNAAAITESPGDLDTSLIWTGFESWPVGGRSVPPAQAIRLLGIFGAPVAHGDSTVNKGYSTYLKLLREGDVLFDDSQNGIPFVGNVEAITDEADYTAVSSMIGPLTAEQPQPPLLFAEPLAFTPGGTLTPQLVVSGAAASGIAAGEVDVALLLERELAG